MSLNLAGAQTAHRTPNAPATVFLRQVDSITTTASVPDCDQADPLLSWPPPDELHTKLEYTGFTCQRTGTGLFTIL